MSDQSSEQAVRRGRLERRRPRSSSGKTRFVIAVLAFTCVGVAAAAAGSNRTQARSTGSHSAVAAAPRIVYVNNASSAGPFADPIRRGFNSACRQFHVRCTYRSTRNTTFDPREQTRLIDAAVAEKPDGLMVTDSTANVLNPHIRAAVLAGIPAIIVNSGIGQAGARTGALTYVGNDEYESGRLAGQLLSQIGAKTLLVVTVSPGLALVDQRMAGVRQGFRGAGRVIRVEIPLKDLGDPAKVRNAITSSIAKNHAIDGVFSVGQLFNGSMLSVRSSLGARAARIRWASIDLGPEVVEALKHRQMEFALDQQQWLQGYLPVQFLSFYIRFGFTPPAPIVRTGPAVITPGTIGTYAEGLRSGIR